MTYARKVYMKPSVVKQLFIASKTFKTDIANLQSNRISFVPVLTTQ